MIMSLFKVFDIAGSAMSAQNTRLNTTASNLANAETVSSTEEGAYRARQPVFAAMMKGLYGTGPESVGVQVRGVVESDAPVQMRYAPDNPMANEDGYVYQSNVNMVDEMVNMISASRSYQNNVEVINTSKQLLLATLRMGE
ncbi:flagellar basal-body rod protein FlgC [Thiohalobacter sp. COW1]|uniref:Flagellar basal-body rod protein FlgC n=2 Tax=Thiohalobacteraceae TaxID=3085110 RepID=A0A1Z4VQF0_9GAMM|nr:flagellar basal-body rod protein FlgC [Thiohalobacter thiocyanaticus]BCO31093.1 flagellar basal-body rod protein FlgC [Thiohalobacter sp. COW1]